MVPYRPNSSNVASSTHNGEVLWLALSIGCNQDVSKNLPQFHSARPSRNQKEQTLVSPQRRGVRRVGVFFDQELFTRRPPCLRGEFSSGYPQKLCACRENFQR